MKNKKIKIFLSVILCFCLSVPCALASDFINASHILATNSIKISGIVGDSAGTALSLNIASEDSVKENGDVLEFPFSDSNKPILSYVTQTGDDGVVSDEIIIPDTIDAGSYYLYAMSKEGSQYVNFFVLDAQDSQEVLDKFNEETNPSSLKSYISVDGTMEKIGYSSDKIEPYYDIISDYTIFAKDDEYTLDTLRDAIDRSIALEKAKNGDDISALMGEYAPAFGGTYDDYAKLSQDEKSCFESLIRSIDYKKDGVSLELSKLIVVAKARSSSSLWSNMKEFVTENADVIGADIGQGSNFASIPLKNQPDVFSKMIKDVKNASTISEIKTYFDNAVKAVKKEVASNNSGAGGSGGGGGGSSASFGDVNVGMIPDIKSEDEKLVGGFSDTYNHYSMEAVKYLSDKKIINGYGDGTFRPDNFVTRAEFAKMICTAFLIEAGNEVSFSDVNKSDWYYDSITNLASQGILLGDGTLFRPDELIMRQDAALIISRILSYFGFEYENDSTVFADDAYISDYAKDAVSKMKNAGIVVGNGLNFSPLSDITRGEAAVLVYRAFNERMEAVQ
ncbi:MAG: S-layer homology domain-containing protein [Clostridia bacterium]|nr:S-layer homology domain-containing protein [Clostridia bacterium]